MYCCPIVSGTRINGHLCTPIQRLSQLNMPSPSALPTVYKIYTVSNNRIQSICTLIAIQHDLKDPSALLQGLL